MNQQGFPRGGADVRKFPHSKRCRAQNVILVQPTGIHLAAREPSQTVPAVTAACNIELWRTKALMNREKNQDITLAAHADLSDLRGLKPEADRIGQYFEAQRRTFENVSGNDLQGGAG